MSLNQFIATAVAEKVAALTTEKYLASRAQRGSRNAFDQALSKVPAVFRSDISRVLSSRGDLNTPARTPYMHVE